MQRATEKKRIMTVINKLIPLINTVRTQTRYCKDEEVLEILHGLKDDIEEIYVNLSTSNLTWIRDHQGERLF